MPLQAAGRISLEDIVAQFRPGYSGPSNINEYYRGGTNVPSSVAGRADVQTFFGSGTRANIVNADQTQPETYEFRLGENFTTTPLEIDESESFTSLVSMDEVGSTGVFVTGGVTTGTASTFSGGGGTADVNYIRTNAGTDFGGALGAQQSIIASSRSDQPVSYTVRADDSVIAFVIQAEDNDGGSSIPTANVSFSPTLSGVTNGSSGGSDAYWGFNDNTGNGGAAVAQYNLNRNFGIAGAGTFIRAPAYQSGDVINGGNLNNAIGQLTTGQVISFNLRSGVRATLVVRRRAQRQFYNYAVRNDRMDGVSVVLTSPVSATLTPDQTSSNYRTNVLDTSDDTAITGSFSWPGQAQFGVGTTRNVTLSRSSMTEGSSNFSTTITQSNSGFSGSQSGGGWNVIRENAGSGTGSWTGRVVGSGTLSGNFNLKSGSVTRNGTSVYSVGNEGGSWSVSVSNGDIIVWTASGGAGGGGTINRNQSWSFSGFNIAYTDNTNGGRSGSVVSYTYSANNANAFAITLTGGVSSNTTLPASSTGTVLSSRIGTSNGTIGWNTQAIASVRNFFAAHNTNIYDVSVNGVNVPANTNFGNRVTFASSLPTTNVTARVTATVPVTTAPTFSIDLDTSDMVFSAGPITGTFPVNADGSSAMQFVRDAVAARVVAGDYSGIRSDDVGDVTQSGGLYRFTVNTNQTTDLTGSFTCVTNQGRNVDCSINAEFFDGNTMVPATLITVTDPEGTQVTSFSAGGNATLEEITQQINNAINLFDETPPTNYTSVRSASNANIVMTADTQVSVANPWRIVVDHGTTGNGDIAFGATTGDSSGNAARTTPGVTAVANLNSSIPEDGEISFENFYGTRRLTAAEQEAQG